MFIWGSLIEGKKRVLKEWSHFQLNLPQWKYSNAMSREMSRCSNNKVVISDTVHFSSATRVMVCQRVCRKWSCHHQKSLIWCDWRQAYPNSSTIPGPSVRGTRNGGGNSLLQESNSMLHNSSLPHGSSTSFCRQNVGSRQQEGPTAKE